MWSICFDGENLEVSQGHDSLRRSIGGGRHPTPKRNRVQEGCRLKEVEELRYLVSLVKISDIGDSEVFPGEMRDELSSQA